MGVARAENGSRLKYDHSQAPQYILYVVGKFFRVLSVYACFRYLDGREVSISIFMFICLLVSGSIFLIFQRPWNGRPLTNSQIISAILNGGIFAFGLVCWGKGLTACGPVRTVFAEYAGAVLGGASTLVLSGGGHYFLWKAGGLVAMLVAFFLLSQGWAMGSFFPFSIPQKTVNEGSMRMSIIAGLTLALGRVIARRISLKTRSQKRLHSLTVAAAACFMFPFAMFQLMTSNRFEDSVGSSWAYIAYICFGIMVPFYMDIFAEKELKIYVASTMHLVITAGWLMVFELVYNKKFSLIGFLICASILGIGVFHVTKSDIGQRNPVLHA